MDKKDDSKLEKEAVCQCWEVLEDNKNYPFDENHSKFFKVRYVGGQDLAYIDRKDVIPYSIENEDFVFSRISEDCVDLYNPEVHPFFYVSVHKHTVELIRVTITVVSAEVERKMERQKYRAFNCYYLHNIGRCGSTLVANMVHQAKQHLVISEPGVLQSVIGYGRHHNWEFSRDNKNLIKLLRNVMILLLPNTDTKYFIKPRASLMLLGHCLREALPGIKEVFMYRALKPTLISFTNVFGALSKDQLLPENILKDMIDVYLGGNAGNHIANHNTYEYVKGYILTFQLATFITKYAEMPVFCYEDLMKDKENFCKKLFYELDIPEDYVKIGLSALDRDSQTNSELNKNNVSRFKSLEVSQECLEWCRNVGRDMGIRIEGSEYQFLNLNEKS